MDPLENGLFDLPDYEHTEDENFPPLPPPHSPGAGDDAEDDLANGDDWTENARRTKTQTEEASKPIKRAVKRPQPKLDAMRLTSKRGLPALRHLFDGTKFKGKGHETEDLKVLICQMENWAHRLFPKLQFEDFLNRLEFLGNKKEVQTCLKRIRMDLPIVHEDFSSEEVIVQMEDHDADIPSEDFSVPTERSVSPSVQPVNVDLSEETLQRIERNRRLALERRMVKMQTQADSQEHALSTALSQKTPSDLDEIPDDFDVEMLDAAESSVSVSMMKQSHSPVHTEVSLGLQDHEETVQEPTQTPESSSKLQNDAPLQQVHQPVSEIHLNTSSPSSPRKSQQDRLHDHLDTHLYLNNPTDSDAKD
ncbi:hypothetical protein GDO86_006495 [Hymenochirus boettgeri]|uniref:TIMELESS-interacting protein n=1 Tax=Hymenochirus boettgeri TaxID=247094 RepID=A0A8T2JBW7_9PIPI|nr:hypothetical protein GDO86_006495 [Hymenochirus boettgeri]